MAESHAKCKPTHICQEPSGRVCCEPECTEPAGTWWGPYWCPAHDKERLDRVSLGFESIMAEFRTSTDPAHDCESCEACLHDGHKCCGCYDGACCKPGE